MSNPAAGVSASAMNYMGMGPLVFVIAMVLVVDMFWYFSRQR